jgi:hypothetical protein
VRVCRFYAPAGTIESEPATPSTVLVSSPAPPFAADPPVERTASAGGLSRSDWARLAGWKLRMAGRHALDAAGGYGRMEKAGRRWSKGWKARYEDEPYPMRSWLGRSGAGEFWLPAHGASGWARDSYTPGDLEIAPSGGGRDLRPARIGSCGSGLAPPVAAGSVQRGGVATHPLRYGVRSVRPCLVAEGEVTLPCLIVATLRSEA